MSRRCRKCGYFDADHEQGEDKCPVCACGATPAEHENGNCPCDCGQLPSRHRVPWLAALCSGRRSKDSGTWLTLRRGTFDPAPPPDRPAWRPGRHAAAAAAVACFPMRIDWQMVAAQQAADVVRSLPPQVPARSPMGPGEIAGAGGQKQATKLGRRALAAGWAVEALYWRAGDGTEGCALRLARGTVRAVATWQRKPGQVAALTGWAATEAYVWQLDVPGFPTKIKHAELDDLLGTC